MKDAKTGRCFFRMYLNEELHDAVLKLSHDSGVPVSAVMRRALENWVATGQMPARVVPEDHPEAQLAGNITPADIDAASEAWDAAMPDFAGLLDAGQVGE